MKKFLGVVCLILGLTLLVSSIVNIVQPFKENTAVAFAESPTVDMPPETYQLNVDQNNLMFSCVSPYGWGDEMGSTYPNFVLYCFNNEFVLGAISANGDLIPNELQFIQRFTLSTTFDVFSSVDGWFDDYAVASLDFRVQSSFTVSNPNLFDYVCFEVDGFVQRIRIHIKPLNRLYTVTITSEEGKFSPYTFNQYFYELNYYDINTLFQNGYNEGYDYGREVGFTQGKDYGYGLGYQQGIEETFSGDLFGSSIVPSINSLMSIELLPNISFSTIFSVVFGLILIGLCIKIFLGG